MAVLIEFAQAEPLTAALVLSVVSLFMFFLWNKKKGDLPYNPLYPPELPGRLPLMGHALAFGKDPRGFVEKWTKHYPKAFIMDLVGTKFVMLPKKHAQWYYNAPEDELGFDEAVKKVLALEFTLGRECVDFPLHVIVLKSKFTPNLRRLASAVSEQIKIVFRNKINNPKQETYVEPLTSDSILVKDPKGVCMEIIARSSSRTFFGPEVYENPELLKSFVSFHSVVDDVNMTKLLMPTFVAKLKSYNVRRHYQLWEDLLYPVIAQRRAEMQAAKDSGVEFQRYDLLQFMMDSKNPDGTPVVEEVIANRMGVLIFASMSTTAGALHNILYRLAMHPDVCQKIYEEQKEVMEIMNNQDLEFERDDGDATYSKSAFEKMKYLEATIRESLRIQTAVLSGSRLAMSDLQIADDLIIPKGTIVSINLTTVHIDDEIYPDPTEFRPERFLGKGHTVGTDFLTFGIGKHACPGRFFAYHEIKCTLSHLVRNFEISMKDPHRQPTYGFNGLNPTTENLQLILKRRAVPLEKV